MKKVLSLVMIIVCIGLIMSSSVFAINPSITVNNGQITAITGNDYQDAQGNETKDEASNNSTEKFPQTGIEDNVGILLIVCVASAIFAYKKIKYYNV